MQSQQQRKMLSTDMKNYLKLHRHDKLRLTRKLILKPLVRNNLYYRKNIWSTPMLLLEEAEVCTTGIHREPNLNLKVYFRLINV